MIFEKSYSPLQIRMASSGLQWFLIQLFQFIKNLSAFVWVIALIVMLFTFLFSDNDDVFQSALTIAFFGFGTWFWSHLFSQALINSRIRAIERILTESDSVPYENFARQNHISNKSDDKAYLEEPKSQVIDGGDDIDITGEYELLGIDPNGTRYSGEVFITYGTSGYTIRWELDDGTIFKGKGQLKEDYLEVECENELIEYDFSEEDGEFILMGSYAEGKGKEDLIKQ